MIRRFMTLPAALFVPLAATLYLLSVPTALLWAYPGIETFGHAMINALPGALVMGLFLFWVRIEFRIRRRLIERLPAYPFPRTRAHRRVERRADILLGLFVAFFASAPALATWLGDGRVGFEDIAPASVWGFLLYAYGWRRLRAGMLSMFRERRENLEETAEELARGILVTAGKSGTWAWRISPMLDFEAPVIEAEFRSTPATAQSEMDIVTLDDRDRLALMLALTGNGDPNRLRFAIPLGGSIHLEDASRHGRMAAAASIHDARKRADALLG